VQHLSKTYWYIDNLQVQDPKTYLNASFGLRSGGLTATIWGKNLLDTRAYETYDPKQATGLPYDVAYPNQPIAYGIDLSMRF
jgi:outer membrane receptor protein involved in Fe transport